MDVPSETYEELKCMNCSMYLSRSPVYLQHKDGKGLCCQCFSPEQPATRNKQYECLAKFIKFPCKYRAFGCKSMVPFIDGIKDIAHEEMCSFRQYACPVFGFNNCEWRGSKDEILQHCRDKHPKQVVENPITLTHDIRYSSVQSYLLIAFELLFLLHTKICISTGKIYYAVCLFNDLTKADEFNFTVDVTRKDISISRSEKVISHGCLAPKEPNSAVFSINSLLEVLNGFSETTFTVTLRKIMKNKVILCTQCKNEVSKLVYREENGWWCDKCTPSKRECKNKCKGCTYIDFQFKCVKHEMYFCQFATHCYLCDKNISEESLFIHYNLTHERKTRKAGSIWQVIKTDYSVQCCLVASIVGPVVCLYGIYDSQLQLYVHVPVSSELLIQLRCTIQITRPETNDLLSFTPDLSFGKSDDWRIILRNSNFPWKKDGLNLSVNITQE